MTIAQDIAGPDIQLLDCPWKEPLDRPAEMLQILGHILSFIQWFGCTTDVLAYFIISTSRHVTGVMSP